MVSVLRVLARTRSLYGAGDQLDSRCSYRRGDRVKGCEFITLISGAATSPITWPLAARAQQPWRLAVLILHYSQTTVRVKRASRRSSIHSRSWAGVMAATSGWSIA